jgi:Tol biopolymer transport system component
MNGLLVGPYFGQEPPGGTPQVFADGIISGNNLHATPTLSPDGREIYWAVCGSGPGLCRIYFSQMLGNDLWTTPELASFTVGVGGDNPVFHPDGQRLFFNSDRPYDGVVKERIWYVNRQDDGTWSDPAPIDPIINDHALHWQISVDNTGRLYFGAARDPSYGGDDIFFSDIVDGHYGEPVNLGPAINTADHESMPFIDPDRRFILFSRLANGSFGVLMSRRNPDGTWSEAVDLSGHCHTDEGAGPQVSPDGAYLFFLKYGGVDFDIFWVDSSCIPDE